ncbi:MAG: aspartate--tRNA ligase, partial [Actinobacteria bacterium]|nr:aspartate--tRNA ligase [Actinomycetota bacterium]
MRTDRCGDLRSDDVGRQVTLCGWVARRREHGEHLAFVDLRDRSGIIQVVVDGAADLRSEYVLQVTGEVRERPADTANDSLATGAIEVDASEVTILSASEPPPFPLDERTDVDEVLRLRHRYVDLRRPRLQKNLEVRAAVNSAVRTAMEEQGFIEVETPMLVASTPEGARDFVVPSRKEPGSFYALPQSPQIFKQLCMIGGVDR